MPPWRVTTDSAVEEICCALDNYYIQVMNLQSLSFHIPNHCRHQACCNLFLLLMILIDYTDSCNVFIARCLHISSAATYEAFVYRKC
jgi:hypothetical protein